MSRMQPYVIAEIAQGFEGDPKLCKRFIDLAAKVGASAVKFQIFEASEICTPEYKYNDLFKNLEIHSQQWIELINYAKEKKIDFFADIFGLTTFKWIKDTGLKGIKIHGTDIKNKRFLKELRSFNGTFVLSTGGGYLEEIKDALTILEGKDVVLMTGFQGEPNREEDVELNKISILKNMFGKEIGYADHFDANEPLAITLPAMAYLAGANYIEKHLTIERNTLQLEDYVSALNPTEFVQMLSLLASSSRFENSSEFKLSEREHEYRLNTKKVPVAIRNLEKDHLISESDIDFLRVGEKPKEILDLSALIGRKLKKAIKTHEAITSEILQ